MKNNILIIAFLSALMMGMTSCEKYFQDVNLNPNNPTSVTVDVQLPAIQGRIAYVLGGDASRYMSIYTHHITGVTRQFAVIQPYGIATTDVNTMWGTNLYAGALTDIRALSANASEQGYNHYVAVAKILEAYTMFFLTDFFGDVPYAEALQGVDNLNPSFDSQESIYAASFANLDEALALLAGDGGGKVPNGGSDQMYGGDVASWMAFAHFLKARAYMHLTEMDAGNYAKALTELGNGFADNSQNAGFQFINTPTTSAPWYQYNEQRTDIVIDTNFVNMLNGLADPRAAMLGAELDTDNPYLSADRNLPFGTYAEQMFLVAECEMNAGNTTGAHTAYMGAIIASIEEVNGDTTGAATYVASVDPGAANLTLENIMDQKYIAMFTRPESFSDWRRTGFPTITPNDGGTAFAARLPYPSNEIEFNTSMTDAQKLLTIFDKVWWDK